MTIHNSLKPLFAALLFAQALAQTGRADCFMQMPSSPTFAQRVGQTNGNYVWEVRRFQAVLYFPTSGSTCDDVVTFTNPIVSITGGVLLGFAATPSTVPP